MLFEIDVSYIFARGFLYQLVATLSAFFLVRTSLFFHRRHKRYQLFKLYGIPGPEPRILGGSMEEAFCSKTTYLNEQKWRKQYGKVFGYFSGDEPCLVVSDLNLIKKIFLERQDIFHDRSESVIDSHLMYGVLFSTYPRWKFMRKIMSPVFSSYSIRGTKSTQFIEESIGLMIEYIDNKLGDSNKAVIDLHSLMKSTALHLINSIALELPDVKVKERDEYVYNLDKWMSSWNKGVVVLAMKFPMINPLLQFLYDHVEYSSTMGVIHKRVTNTIKRDFERLDKLKSQDIDTHDNHGEHKILNTMIKLHHDNKLTRREVFGNVEAMLIAGYDTTSTTLTYIFWALGKHPEVQERLRSELLTSGIESKYLDQVIKETMRIYPIVLSFIARLTSETVQLDQLTIPKGTKMIYNSWLMNRNPEHWPEPDKFDPERFRPGVEVNPLIYAPFGIGHRKCLGLQLAYLELKMIVCDIVIRYKINLIGPQELKLVTYSQVLTKPQEKVMIELEKLLF